MDSSEIEAVLSATRLFKELVSLGERQPIVDAFACNAIPKLLSIIDVDDFSFAVTSSLNAIVASGQVEDVKLVVEAGAIAKLSSLLKEQEDSKVSFTVPL